MSKSNDVTGDRITNALKGDKDAYREGWEAIFGQSKKETSVLDDLRDISKEMDKMNLDNYVSMDNFLDEADMEALGELFTLSEEEYLRLCEEDNNDLLDKLTQDNDRVSKDSDIEMGLYDE